VVKRLVVTPKGAPLPQSCDLPPTESHCLSLEFEVCIGCVGFLSFPAITFELTAQQGIRFFSNKVDYRSASAHSLVSCSDHT
jgi:hypothetical protein